MSDNCTARNDLLVALHTLASHFENALYAFGDDDEARKKAEGDIAWARLVASRHNYNGSECKEIERLRGEATQLRQALGMLTTLHPTMEIDVNNPMQMAKEIVSYVTESRDTEIEQLRGLVYAVPPTEHATGQTWKEACEANRDEVARLDNLLRTYRLPDEVVDIKVVIELRAEIERLRGLLREALRVAAGGATY